MKNYKKIDSHIFFQQIQIVECIRKPSSNPLSPLISNNKHFLEPTSPLFLGLCRPNKRMIPNVVMQITGSNLNSYHIQLFIIVMAQKLLYFFLFLTVSISIDQIPPSLEPNPPWAPHQNSSLLFI